MKPEPRGTISSMEVPPRRRDGTGWYLLATGTTFLALSAIVVVLWGFGVFDFRAMTGFVLQYGLMAGFNFLAYPLTMRTVRFQEVPPSTTKEDWTEGLLVAPSRGPSWLPIRDCVRLGVEGGGLRVRRILRPGLVGGILGGGFFLLAMAIIVRNAEQTEAPDAQFLVLLGIGFPALLALTSVAVVDPPESRHDILRPWTDVDRIVGGKDSLAIHWKDGNPFQVSGIPPYALRRILPRMAVHVPVEEWAGPLPRPSQPSGPSAIDGETGRRLDEALESLRRLDS